MAKQKKYWEPNGITFRPRRTLKVLKILMESRNNTRSILSRIIPPEIANLPSIVTPGSREHALILMLFTFISRHGTKTNDIIEKASKLLMRYPSIWDPLAPGEPDEEVLEELFAFPRRKTYVQYWKNNLLRLKNQYKGDPRRIFTAPLDRKTLLEKIQQFDGFGLKIASLFIVFCQGVDHWDIIPIEELRKIKAFPPDIHFMRLLRKCDLIKNWDFDHHKGLSKKSAEFIAELLDRYNLSSYEASQASYELGSTICQSKPSDPILQANYCKQHCPINALCVYTVESRNYTKNGRLDFDQATKRTRIL